MAKKWMTVLLAFVLLLPTAGIFRSPEVSATAMFEGGSGTALDPYLISTPVQLNNIRNANGYFKLTQNIDLTAYLSSGGSGYNGGKGWIPIGNMPFLPFGGVLDGNGHTITGLKINSSDQSTGMFQGLSGTVKNLGIVEANVVSTHSITGILVGTNASGTIQNCFVTGSVSSTYDTVGGMVGENIGTITNSYSLASVRGTTKVGGLVGNYTSNGYYTVGFSNSFAAGLVTATLPTTDKGGLVGASSLAVVNSYYDTTNSGQSDTGKGVGKDWTSMMMQTTYSGWDFTTVWSINELDDYPKLRVFSAPTPPTDTPPTAAPTLMGTAQVGRTLTAISNYNDTDSDPESGTTYAFYRYDADGTSNETLVQEASDNNTYTIAVEDLGKVIKVKVTPKNEKATGATATSAPTAVIAEAPIYKVLNNGKIRFGNGAKNSVNSSGNLEQPFYYGSVEDELGWYKLTYRNNPLDNAIGLDGNGTLSEWNTNGVIKVNPELTNQVIDLSGYVSTGLNQGYGTIISTGTTTINGKTLEVKNTYTLGETSSFVKIVTQVTNKSGAKIENLRFWTGTKDDYVGISDTPKKERGNLVNGNFVKLTDPANRANALLISSEDTGVLFYSTSAKANTSIQECCDFENSIFQDPSTSDIESIDDGIDDPDGSYALFIRMNDLDVNESGEFTWYYAAGEISKLGDISNEVGQTTSAPPSTSPTTPVSATPGSVEILVNGKVESAGTATTTTVNNQTVTTVVIDPKKLEEKLAKEGQHAVVTIPVTAKSDVVIGELNGQMVKNLEGKQAIVELKTDKATYTLPAQQINIEAISNKIGKSVALQDIKVQIEIAAPTADTVKVVANAAEKGTFTLVVPPVEFTVKATYGEQTIEVSTFNAYVERTIAIPDGAGPSKITTGVVVDPDGTVRHVPTKVVLIDGKYYAKINSLTNSTYSVVWHQLQFSDVANHWAKDAVNDMGSRMVIEGTGGSMFSPGKDVTRAEFAAIMVRGLGLKLENGVVPFSDVKSSDWYSSFVNTAYAHHLISGFEDGTFRPNDKITREQAMVILSKAMTITGLKGKLSVQSADATLRLFADASEVSAWAQSSVADSVQAGIVSGRSAAKLAPKDYMTRAEVATIIQSLLQKSGLI
ncbi:S-layer homology domain-containing protein [Cohnella endophytica]|uniref:S-layer homology domain-containing protein n=1 Tax=Cohnella endophytica TaxID=2419778 RepID=A0A494XF95_9BACL|nr:S-layer homology domain-containing protein [Cohnella endophytica]RKP46283.1 S-layer homology domain-containing protein [Cohnella endophytica]